VDIFDGLDQIRWDQMEHAYGPAVEVPDILRGLVDPDPAVRETSLDAFYGGVHHQGDVYKCTVKAIPFLIRIARSAQAHGRAQVLDLLRSLGGWDPGDDEPRQLKGRYRKANELIAADWSSWLALLDDPDPLVKLAAAGLLGVCVDAAGEVVAAVRQHTVQEQFPRYGPRSCERWPAWPEPAVSTKRSGCRSGSTRTRIRSYDWTFWPSWPRCRARYRPTSPGCEH
jgi:hypothetical protein